MPLDTDQKDYLQLAKDMFLKALEIEPQCPYTNARCAKALWAMPVPYKDKERAKQAILHALTLAPDSSFVRKIVLNESFMILILHFCIMLCGYWLLPSLFPPPSA
jgi:hypothetical protein